MADFNRDNKFGKKGPKRFDNNSSSRFGRDDSPRFGGRSGGQFERRDNERSFEKRMFNVTCAKCGNDCEVPFKPTGNKPVYCSNCFRKDDNYGPKQQGPSKSEFDEINAKLDKIMEALDIE